MKNLIYTLLLLTAFIIQSCETEIPPTDTEPPQFSFTISGDGFQHTFTQDDEFHTFQVSLREDTEYEFTYSLSENGGLSWARMQFPNDLDMSESASTTGWTRSDITVLQSAFTWQGDENNPVTGAIIQGTFRSEISNISPYVGGEFIFLAKDYGGQSGDGNEIIERLNLQFGDHDSEIVYYSK